MAPQRGDSIMLVIVRLSSHARRTHRWRRSRRCGERPSGHRGNLVATSGKIGYLTPFMNWPAYFPPDCPGSESVPADGRVWRLVRSKPPNPDDFRPHKIMRPAKDWGERECEACGLSIHRDASDSTKLRQRVPAFRRHLLASANLTAANGLTLPTPSDLFPSHETWWVPQSIEPWTLFTVSDEVSEGAR